MLPGRPKRAHPNGISSRAAPGPCRVKQLNRAAEDAEHHQEL